MLSMLRNERGGVFIYVLLIVMLIAVFTPVILNNISSAQQQDIQYEFEETARQLAVSGLEAFLSVPEAEWVGYLSQHFYTDDNPVVMNVPGSGDVQYYQYVVAIGDSNDISNAVASTDVDLEEQRVVIIAISGDPNGNMEKNLGERYFKMTQLTKEFKQPEASGQTATPEFIQGKFPEENNTQVEVTAEPDSEVLVEIYDTNGTKVEEKIAVFTNQSYIADLLYPLETGYFVHVYATATGKLISDVLKAKVIAAGTSSGNGLVQEVDDDGNITYIEFKDQLTLDNDALVVTSGFNSGDPYTTTNDIDLEAKAITFEPGVNITSDSSGNAVVGLTSTSGDITIEDASIASSGNSQHSEISISSSGDVHMDNSTLEAERTITITAEGNIYVREASLTTLKNNSTITFILNGAGSVLYMDGITITTDDNNNAAVEPDGAQICGTVSSGLVDDSTSYTGGHCME